MKSQVPKIIFAVILLLVLGAGSYLYYYTDVLKGLSIGGISLSDLTLPTDESPIGSDILVLAEKIRKTEINPEVFETPLFRSLRDFSVIVNPEEQGKPNPFTPLVIQTANAVLAKPGSSR